LSLDARDFGFWRSFGGLKISQVLFSWDFLVAAGIAGAGTFFYVQNVTDPKLHNEIVQNFVSVNGDLFGVVLAGFAIVAALLGDKYSRLLEAAQSSATHMLRHFLIVGGILVSSIVISIIFRANAEPLYSWEPVAEQIGLGIATFFFLWGLFGALELMKLVLGVAATNSALHSLSGGREEGGDRQAK
jgi:hypothetical protein